MTALPTTSGWFSADAEVVVNGTSHRLLLGVEHAIDVRSVHNLLRETYHSVALLDADPSRRRRLPLRLWQLGTRRTAAVADEQSGEQVMPPCGPVAPPPPPPPPPREPPPRRSGGAATASGQEAARACTCLLYTSPSPRD